jgi:hypothetical protein
MVRPARGSFLEGDVVDRELDCGHLPGVEPDECGRSEGVFLGSARMLTLPRAASETPDAGRLPEPWRLGCSDGENWGRG